MYSIISELSGTHTTTSARTKNFTISTDMNHYAPTNTGIDSHLLTSLPYSTAIEMGSSIEQDELFRELFCEMKCDKQINGNDNESKVINQSINQFVYINQNKKKFKLHNFGLLQLRIINITILRQMKRKHYQLYAIFWLREMEVECFVYLKILI